jgi:hypothetical protein
LLLQGFDPKDHIKANIPLDDRLVEAENVLSCWRISLGNTRATYPPPRITASHFGRRVTGANFMAVYARAAPYFETSSEIFWRRAMSALGH